MPDFSTRSALHRRLSTFVGWVATEPSTEDAIRRQADDVRSRIKGQAADDGLIVRSTPNGGSFAKRTGLRRHLLGGAEVDGQDVDLPFVLSPRTKDDEKVERLLDRFERYAKASYPNTPCERTKSSVALSFVASKLSFDLVPMLATANDDEQILLRGDGEQRRTSIQKNIQFIASRTRSSDAITGRVRFNECVRLMKWWRDVRLSTAQTLTDLPTFVLELLAAKAYDSQSVAETYAQTLARWFAFFADLVAKRAPVTFTDFTRGTASTTAAWFVLDPVNPENNATAKWAGYQIDELAEWFATGRDAWGRALSADLRCDDAASLTALVDLFGNPIRHHGGDG